jgi:hypothetical protein
MARQFPGGYKKSEFDKKQDKLAAQAADKIRAQHRADLEIIRKAAEQAFYDEQLREAAAKYNALIEGNSKKRSKTA